MTCFRFYDSSGVFEVFACGESASYEYVSPNDTPYWPGSTSLVTPIVDGVAIAGTGYVYGNVQAQIQVITSFPITRIAPNSTGNCDACQTAPAVKYDCINGVCTAKATYNTPGLYQSLADCQAVCANGGSCAAGKQCVDPTTFCPPGKVCLEQSEVNDINNLLAKIQSEACH